MHYFSLTSELCASHTEATSLGGVPWTVLWVTSIRRHAIAFDHIFHLRIKYSIYNIVYIFISQVYRECIAAPVMGTRNKRCKAVEMCVPFREDGRELLRYLRPAQLAVIT